jgi:transketolase
MSPMDVALLDTLPGWRVHVPGHADEVTSLLRAAMAHDERVYIRLSTMENSRAHGDGAVVREGGGRTVVAVGPMLDPVLEATEGLDFRIVYTNTPRPLRVDEGAILVEPYLEGTSAHLGRFDSIGVKRVDLHRYGSPKDHARWHGLDPASLRARLLAM